MGLLTFANLIAKQQIGTAVDSNARYYPVGRRSFASKQRDIWFEILPNNWAANA